MVARKTLPSLRITAYQLIKDTLSAWKIKYDENKTARIIQVGPNQVYFSGLDDPEKIKSAEFNYVWIEEATDVKKEDFLQVNLRTRRRNADGPNQIYLSFNPIDAHHWLITDIVEGPRKDNTIIHHSTYLDNPYLPQDYVDELESLQERDENFYRIYTLGQPGVLKGLIYQNYDVIPWPAKAGHPTRDADMMGLDFGFNNKMALITIRYIEGEFYLKELFYESEKTTQDLIAWMKKHLHNKNIPIYADAAEPDRIEEIRRAGFNVWPARKEVVPGIDHVKAQILHISSDSPNTIKEFRNYKWREDKDGNTLDEPVKFMDHACLVPGTRITTATGYNMIENIHKGDRVLTRRGYKTVTDAGRTCEQVDTITIVLDNGKTITGTRNHPVHVIGRGFIPIDAIRYGDYILSEIPESKKSSLTGSFLGDIRTRRTPVTGNITGRVATKRDWESGTYIRRYGSTITSRSQQATRYTTKTGMRIITALKTLSASKRQSTCAVTPTPDWKTLNINKKCSSIWKILDHLRANGTGRMTALNGIQSMGRGHGKTGHPPIKNASSAVKYSRVSGAEKATGSAQMHARPSTGENLEWTTKQEYANIVTKNLQSINIQKRFIARKVVQLKAGGKSDVYNISVADTPEYFANGVLVHNCDAIRYAIYTAKAGSERVPIEALKSETQIPDMDPWDDYGDYDQDLPF